MQKISTIFEIVPLIDGDDIELLFENEKCQVRAVVFSDTNTFHGCVQIFNKLFTEPIIIKLCDGDIPIVPDIKVPPYFCFNNEVQKYYIPEKILSDQLVCKYKIGESSSPLMVEIEDLKERIEKTGR